MARKPQMRRRVRRVSRVNRRRSPRRYFESIEIPDDDEDDDDVIIGGGSQDEEPLSSS
jgi:hypothetical protein